MNLHCKQIEAIRSIYIECEVDCMTHNELLDFAYDTLIERLPRDEDALREHICDTSGAETWDELVDLVTPDN